MRVVLLYLPIPIQWTGCCNKFKCPKDRIGSQLDSIEYSAVRYPDLVCPLNTIIADTELHQHYPRRGPFWVDDGVQVMTLPPIVCCFLSCQTTTSKRIKTTDHTRLNLNLTSGYCHKNTPQTTYLQTNHKEATTTGQFVECHEEHGRGGGSLRLEFLRK